MTRNLSDSDSLKRLAFANPVWRITIGSGFSSGEYWADVPAGNTKEIILKNPTEDFFFGIFNIEVRVSSEARISKAFNVTEGTEGDPPSTGITNKRSSKDDTNADVRLGGDGETGVYSGGDLFNDKGVGSGAGGGGGANPGDTGNGGFVNVVAPGDNLSVGVTNASSNSMSYISIDIDWAESPQQTFPG